MRTTASYRLPVTTPAGQRQRNRIKYRLRAFTVPRLFFGLWALLIAAIITTNIVGLAVGFVHYRVNGLGYDYSIDIGTFHYHYSRGYDFGAN